MISRRDVHATTRIQVGQMALVSAETWIVMDIEEVSETVNKGTNSFETTAQFANLYHPVQRGKMNLRRRMQL